MKKNSIFNQDITPYDSLIYSLHSQMFVVRGSGHKSKKIIIASSIWLKYPLLIAQNVRKQLMIRGYYVRESSY